MGVGAGIFLWLVANISFAASYVTSWDRAQWTLMPSELACKLTHSIDGFGEARLSREAGGVDQLVIVSRNGLLNRADYQEFVRTPTGRPTLRPQHHQYQCKRHQQAQQHFYGIQCNSHTITKDFA